MAMFNCKRTTYSNHICNKLKFSDKQETAVGLVFALKTSSFPPFDGPAKALHEQQLCKANQPDVSQIQ